VVIHLRPVEEKDIDLLKHWRTLDHVKPYCREFKPVNDLRQKNWFYSLDEDPDNLLFIIVTPNQEPIGCAGIVRTDWKNRKAEITFFIGSRDHLNNASIMASLNEIIDYAFKELNLYKVYFPVYEFNDFLPVYEQVMDREYIAKRELFRFGRYYDRIILTRFNDAKTQDTQLRNGTQKT